MPWKWLFSLLASGASWAIPVSSAAKSMSMSFNVNHWLEESAAWVQALICSLLAAREKQLGFSGQIIRSRSDESPNTIPVGI
jgi:hypothetical protein